MTGMIAIDESGDLGWRGSRFFLMAAVVTQRSRHLLKAYKAAPTGDGPEIKFYDANDKERVGVLKEVADADVYIVCVCFDKYDPQCPAERGNDLYGLSLRIVMEEAVKKYPANDLNISIDESRFINKRHLEMMVSEISKSTGKNIKSCKKAASGKCTRIADYVVGAIRMRYENRDDHLYEIVKEKISFAREPSGPR